MTNDTKIILGIKDPNIKKLKVMNPLEMMGPLKVQAILDYRPKACPKCGVLNQKSIIKYGWRWANVKLPRTAERDVQLHLKKRDFKCKHCLQYFLAETPLVQRNHTISNTSKLACFLKLSETVSMRHVATELSISSTTVLQIMRSYQGNVKTRFDWLPAVINMDEVKSTKDAKGSMSFVFMDGIRCEFLDILESRTLYDLENYFKRYTKKARESVKVIVTDMNYTYPKLAESIFPNAIVVTDRFHIVNSVMRGFTRVRIRIMKSYAPSNMKYKALKRYWRLFFKPNEKLDFKKYSNYTNIPGSQTENSVVEYLLDINEELREAYNQLQTVMSAVRYRDIARLETVLDGKDNGSEEMTKALNALVENRESVDNALRYEFSNGPMEGINNKIKVIKRVAYGFGCFTSFRLRIHLAFGLKKNCLISKD